MVTSNHYITIYANNQLLDLEDQDSLNLRMNDVLFDPQNTKTSQATYSFTFKVPSTENNNKIFGFANAIDQNNKFNKRYDALVYSDEVLIFNGSLVVKEYDAEDKYYNCNLVNIKIYSLDEIFGDDKLCDLDWEVDFSGATSINAVNANPSSKYFFPLVSYGVFQKRPKSSDEVGNEYTSKFVFDTYNRWWVETFYPSLNMLEIIKKAFEGKGFNVMGTAYNDPVISNVYTSVNLSDEQIPLYNLGNSRFGVFDGDFTFTTTNTEKRWQQDLSFPYYRVDPTSNQNGTTKYNLATVDIWNVLDVGTVTSLNSQYLYDPTESVIVVPADGWYKIEILLDGAISGYNTTFTSSGYYNSGDCEAGITTKNNMQFTRELGEDCPFELQLVKNYDLNVELIKGNYNVRYLSGDKNEATFQQSGCGYTSNTVPNKIEWYTEFPHQDLYSAFPPTETSAILTTSVGQTTLRSGRNSTDSMYGGITEPAPPAIRAKTRKRPLTASTLGYMTHSGKTQPYDAAVSEAFICGFSSFQGGIASVMKNGNSWSNLNTVTNEIFAKVDGLDYVTTSGTTSSTTYCQNSYLLSPTNTCSVSTSSMTGHLFCSVYLHRNDVLELLAIQRSFDSQKYAFSGSVGLYIEASSPKSRVELEAKGYNYQSLTDWNNKLELGHWINDEVKTKDWIENVLTAFNLQLTQQGNNIIIDTNRGLRKTITAAVDIDDRASENEATTSVIEYPRSMKVTYKVDKDEWGFEQSVPQAYINLKDWYNYGDSGYTVVKMSNDIYTTKENNTSTDFSYTWYDNFHFSGNNNATVSIPVISKAEYMVDGYGYDEAMQNDGYSLTQRFWFRPTTSSGFVYLSSYNSEVVQCYCPMNAYQTVNLSYKDSEKSLLTEYFNFVPMLQSNFVEIDVYLNPIEYKLIRCGARVRFCTDYYYVSEIEGYDPSGGNPTTLKLIKAVN